MHLPAGARPNAAVAAGDTLYVGSTRNRRVLAFDVHTGRPLPGAALRVPRGTTGLAVRRGSLWVANRGGAVLRVPLRGGHATPAPLSAGGAPIDIDAGRRAIWVAVQTTVAGLPDRLVELAPGSGRELKSIPVPAGVRSLAVGEGAVWAVNRRRDSVLRVGLRDGAQTTVPVGGDPQRVAVGFGAAWVTSAGDDAVTRINARVPARRIQIAVGRDPAGIGVSRRVVWVADRLDSTVTRIDPRSNRTVGSAVRVGLNPFAVVMAGGVAWVTGLGDATLSRVTIRR
jgi:DNA-binding beta-propeller fold protein YncE